MFNKIKKIFNNKFLFLPSFVLFFVCLFNINSYALPNWSYPADSISDLKISYNHYFINWDSMNSRYTFYGSYAPFNIEKSAYYDVLISPSDNTEFDLFIFTEGADGWSVPYFNKSSNFILTGSELVGASETIEYEGETFFYFPPWIIPFQMEMVRVMGVLLSVGLSILLLMLLPHLLKKLYLFF